MRIAHTCACCGLDLSRERAPADPIYGLPIVVCPRCAQAVVRRRHPVQARSRQISANIQSIMGLAVRVAGSLGLAGAIIGLSVLVEDAHFRAMRRDISPLLDEMFIVGGCLWLAVAGAIGVWLGAMFAHWRALPLVAAWLAGLFVLVAIPGLAGVIEDLVEDRARGSVWEALVGPGGWIRESQRVLLLLGASVVPLFVGYPWGRLIERSAGRVRRRRMWRRRRALRRRNS